MILLGGSLILIVALIGESLKLPYYLLNVLGLGVEVYLRKISSD
jgi:hypothetical protein